MICKFPPSLPWCFDWFKDFALSCPWPGKSDKLPSNQHRHRRVHPGAYACRQWSRCERDGFFPVLVAAARNTSGCHLWYPTFSEVVYIDVWSRSLLAFGRLCFLHYHQDKDKSSYDVLNEVDIFLSCRLIFFILLVCFAKTID